VAKQKKSPSTPAQPSAYALMGMRVQKIINSPAAQKVRNAKLYRSPDEPEDDWAQLMQEFAENDNVTIQTLEDGGVSLSWTLPKED
jgi:hypothetical protein